MKVAIPLSDETVRTITLDSQDGIPVVVVEHKAQDGTTKRIEHRLTHETVNLIRRWTEDAYPRGQER